jgi:predicted DCC family thiol-disulfide oxidoreductase YuxK
MNSKELERRKVVLFDGVCNLCNSSVVFILKREKEPTLQFASIQSEAGKELLKWCGLSPDYNQAIILIDKGQVDAGSTAALKIGQYLRFPWYFLAALGLTVPRFIRDWGYSQIARHRYQWFGKRESCMVPTEKVKTRFL